MSLVAGQIFVSTGVGSQVSAVNPEDLYNSFTYTLVAPALTTSAAVYDANDVLQKTLWSSLTQSAGQHTAYWAGDMDDGSVATGTPPFYARVIAHNVQYVWEGIIGNLAPNFTDSSVMVGLNNPVQSAVIAGTNLWVSVGYNEGNSTVSKFALSAPNTKIGSMLNDQGTSPNSIATDGTYLYWISNGGYGSVQRTFVAVQDLSTGNNVSLSSGTPLTLYGDTYSAVDLYDLKPVCTISVASPAVITVANEYVADVPITFATTGALPTGLTAGTTYYVSATGLSTSSFQVSATVGGASINTSGTQSGQHTVTATGLGASGIAVDSSYIAVARPAFGAIHVLNKTTGALVNTVSVSGLFGLTYAAACNQIAFDPSGHLWVISGTSVVEYTSPASSSATGTTISGFTNPLAVACDSSGNVWVADGDDVQQVFKYSSAGALLATFGDAGGYMTDPAVSNTKFWFYWPTASWGQNTCVVPDSSGGVWICNTGLMQILHFTSGGVCDEVLQWGMAVYQVSVDHANPTRVFVGYLEYEIDYTQTLTPGVTAAWTLVRNWLAGGPSGPMATVRNHYSGFASVETLSNGRTYAHVGRSTSYDDSDIFELPSSGLARHSAVVTKPAGGGDYARSMQANGDMIRANIPVPAVGYTESVYLEPLTGFDGSNNPVWGSASVIASVVASTTNPWFRGSGFSPDGHTFAVSSTNKVLFYNGGTAAGNDGYHLGGVPSGGTDFSWQASPTGKIDGKGTFQTKSIDNSVNYGGNQVWAYNRHVFFGYHGENYRDLTYYQVGQANQFYHFYDDGLFIGQFGVPNIAHYRPSEDVHPAGCAGNSFSNTYAYANGNLYWYHGDESVHGGIHRWRIDGIDTISEQDFALRAFP